MPLFGQAVFGDDVFNYDPIDFSVRGPWLFQDALENVSYFLHINPSETTFPGVQKQVESRATPAGGQVLYGSQRAPQTIEFSGAILEQAHYEALKGWAETKRQIKLRDDLGRTFWIYITNFSPTRVKNNAYPWRMTFNASATILNWGNT